METIMIMMDATAPVTKKSDGCALAVVKLVRTFAMKFAVMDTASSQVETSTMATKLAVLAMMELREIMTVVHHPVLLRKVGIAYQVE